MMKSPPVVFNLIIRKGGKPRLSVCGWLFLAVFLLLVALV